MSTERLLQNAEAVLLRACMARHGFHLPPVDTARVPGDRTFPYVVDDVRWARAHGYGSDISARIDALRRADPVQAYLERLSPERRQAALYAANGSPSDPRLDAELPGGAVIHRSAVSCTSDAEQRLYGDLPAWYRVSTVTENLPSLWISQVLADRRYAAALVGWSQCMRSHGFSYATPAQAHEAATGWPREIPTAVAEAECATRTGLGGVVGRLQSQKAAHVRSEYGTVLDTRARLVRAAVPRARAILSAASPDG